LKIAPGGHLGRLIVWTESAFRKLDSIFGTITRKSDVKKDFVFPMAKMVNSDFSRLIRSEEIMKVIRPARKQTQVRKIHRNPLKKPKLMAKLNPYATVLRRKAVLASSKKPTEAKATYVINTS
jgi:large subunit ribosomal protein L4e